MRRLARLEHPEDRGTTLVELTIAMAIFAMIMVGVVGTWSKTQEAYFVGSEAAEVQQNVRAAIDFMVREIRSTGRDVTNCAFDYDDQASLFLDCDSASGKIASCTTKMAGSGTPTWQTNNGLAGGGAGCANLFVMPFADATGTSIRIRSDRNSNGRIYEKGNSITTGPDADAGEEDVRYALASTSPPCLGGGDCISRRVGTTGPTEAMVAVDIAGFRLDYFPKPGAIGCTGSPPSPPPDPCPAYGLPMTQEQADSVAQIRMTITARQTTAGQTIRKTLVTDIVLKNRR